MEPKYDNGNKVLYLEFEFHFRWLKIVMSRIKIRTYDMEASSVKTEWGIRGRGEISIDVSK